MLLTVCIEAGRSTLTHTSSTGLTIGSRKWMSGQAAALAATQSRTPFANLSAPHPLPDLDLASVRRPPSPLDLYLSWMSLNFSFTAGWNAWLIFHPTKSQPAIPSTPSDATTMTKMRIYFITSLIQSFSAARTNAGRIPPIHFLRERLTAFRASPAINLPSRQNPAPYEEYGRHRSSQAGQEKIPREKEHREEDAN